MSDVLERLNKCIDGGANSHLEYLLQQAVDEIERGYAENKRLEALDKDWLRASEQWAAEIERQKHINTTHLEEHQRLESLVHRLQATSMQQAKDGEKVQDKLNMAEAVIEELEALLLPERVSTVPEHTQSGDECTQNGNTLNDRGSDEYANPDDD